VIRQACTHCKRSSHAIITSKLLHCLLNVCNALYFYFMHFCIHDWTGTLICIVSITMLTYTLCSLPHSLACRDNGILPNLVCDSSSRRITSHILLQVVSEFIFCRCMKQVTQHQWAVLCHMTVSEWVDSSRHISTVRLYSATHVVHAGKYRTEDKLIIQTIQKLNTAQKSKTQQKNYPSLVASYDIRPGKEVGLFYNAADATWGEPPDVHSECC